MTGLFLIEHENRPEIVSAVKGRVSTATPLEIEAQLQVGVEYGNPWAQKKLAEHLVNLGRKEEAFELLKKGMEIGYDAAYFTAAMLLTSGNDDSRRREYLASASRLGYPYATYELGKIEKATGNAKESVFLFKKASVQNLAWSRFDSNLEAEINAAIVSTTVMQDDV